MSNAIAASQLNFIRSGGEYAVRESVIFVNPGELQASCALIGWWERSLAELLMESHAWGMFGNMADDGLIGFVGWCLAQDPKPGSFHIESVPGLPWTEDDFDPWDWYEKFMSEIALWDPPPILVNLDEMSITHRGQILFDALPERRAFRKDRRVGTCDSEFPVGWFGQGLGDFRPGPSTYNCYGPDELPPIHAPLTGSFEWLAAATEQKHSLAPNPQSIAKALAELLASHADEIPASFLGFFRSPSLWHRIPTCTDCYLDLDRGAAKIRGGLGLLVRFLSDSQDCIHWNLHISPCGKRHSVVATYFYTGIDHVRRERDQPHPKDITTVADSFEEFIYRFWLENRLWFALHNQGEMPAGGQEYLGFYSATHKAEGESRTNG